MLVSIQGDFLEHAPLHGASAAPEIVELLASGSDQPVEKITPHHLEAASNPWPPPSDGEIRLVERPYQLDDLDAMHLVIGWDGHDHAPRGPLKTGHERRGFAKALREADDDDVLTALQQFLQRGRHVWPRAIQHHDELVGRIETEEPS